MELFYAPNIASEAVLPEDESQHCVKVMRHTTGDVITVTDGKGKLYEARITNPHPKHCELEILSSQQQTKHHSGDIHIAIAPTKNIDRIEWMIEKCTEIGADAFTPLLCRFSERKTIRQDRLEKIIVSASKQSLTAYFPTLAPLTKIEDFIRSSIADYKFIAHCYLNSERKTLSSEIRAIRTRNPEACNASFAVLIGPEGDFSPQEVELALRHGFVPVSLGEARLRTETAGLVACHTIVVMNS